MSSFSDLVARVEALEGAITRPRPNLPDHYAEARVQQVRKRVDRMEDDGVIGAALGTITYGMPVLSTGTFSFDSSYPTGGEDFDDSTVPDPVDVWMQPYSDGGNHYTFTYDLGSQKMLAYDASTGVEVANLTDLSALANLRYVAIGTDSSERILFRNRGDRELQSVWIEVADDVAASATNYWTLTLVRRTTDGERIELGDALALTSRELSANTASLLYEPDDALALGDGDTLLIEVAATGTPTPLTDLVAWVYARRRTA